jgi:Protein of unknown function DUF72
MNLATSRRFASMLLIPSIALYRMLRLALLEMAGFVLCRGATTRLVQALSETLRYRRNQRIFLLMAHGSERSGVAARARQEEVCLHRKSLRAHYRYTKGRLNDIVSELDPARRNVAEFRHASWWNEEVYSAFRKAGIIFCPCSAPRLPDDLIRTADEVYVRMHGPKRWYRHDYSKEELADWATKIKDSGAKRAWVYFNNDFDAYAPQKCSGIEAHVTASTRLSLN